MPKQRVGENESTSSLAKRFGFYWKTIRDHGENAELYQKRKDPNVLAADDQIFIPKLEPKKVSVGTESEHVFVRKGEPTEIKCKFLELGEPRKNAPYIFVVNGVSKNGQTDGDGVLKQLVPGDAKKATIYFKDGTEIHNLRIGSLDPHDLASGIVQRLNNCGFKFSAKSIQKGMSAKEAFEEGKVGNKGVRALKNFQAQNGLDPNGKLDGATIAKFEELCK